jgi:ankyrin repeat protein
VLRDENLVQYLLENGANPNLGKEHLWSSDSMLCMESSQVIRNAAAVATVQVFDLLLKYGARLGGSLALHEAVSPTFTREREQMIEHLIMVHQVAVNELDDAMGPRREGTPLHYAARRSNVAAARLLLKHGADATIRNCWGKTAGDEAENHRSKELAHLLRKNERLANRHRRRATQP